MAKKKLEDVIKRLETKDSISFKAPKYTRIKIINILKTGEFRTLSELMNVAITEWLQMRERKTIRDRILDLLSKDENLRKEILEVLEKEK